MSNRFRAPPVILAIESLGGACMTTEKVGHIVHLTHASKVSLSHARCFLVRYDVSTSSSLLHAAVIAVFRP